MRRFAGGLVVGLSATLLMEYVSQALYDRQSGPSREREEELRAEMPTTTLVRKVAGLTGAQLNDATAERLGMVTHYAFGAAGGPLAVALTDRGTGPLAAGLAVATAMEVGADQVFNTALRLTPPPRAWPTVTHARAVAAHIAYGSALGLMLAAGARR